MFIIKYKNIFLAIGVGIMIISLGLIFGLGLKPGIDFAGGSLMADLGERRNRSCFFIGSRKNRKLFYVQISV